MNIKKALKDYGLTEAQSLVYLSLVKHLEANVSQIAKDTDTPRATVYKALDFLESEDLVATSIKNKVRHYSVTNVKQFEFNLQEKLQTFELVTPLLKEIVHTLKHKPEVTLLTGKQGLRLMYEDIIEETDRKGLKESYVIAGLGARKHLPKYFNQWKARQKAQKVKAYIAYPEHIRKLHEQYAHTKRSSYIEKRYFPDSFVFEGSLDVYGDKVAIASFEGIQPHATIINSPEIARLFKMVWQLVWSSSKP